MEYILIYVLFFGIWFCRIYKQYGFNISAFLLVFYLFSSVCCFCIFLFYPHMIEHPERVKFYSVLYHILVLSLFLSPVVYAGNRLCVEKLSFDTKLLNRFSYCLIIPSILSICLSMGDVINIFAFGNLLDARNTLLQDSSLNYINRFGMLGYLPALGPGLSFLCLFFSFYYRFFLKEKGYITNLLFISSFCIVVFNLTIAGRDGIVRWLLFFLFSVIFFRRYLSFRTNRKFWMVLLVFSIVIISVFLLISGDRFGDRDENTFFYLLNYYGQPFYYFSYHFQRFAYSNIQGISSIFPFITGNVQFIYDLNSLISADYFLNVFATFIGSFLYRTGAVNSFCIGVSAFFLLYWVFVNMKIVSLSKLILFLFMYEIFMLGLFYYMHGGRMTQYTIVFYIFLALILNLKLKWR